MYRSILVPLDGSPLSECALPLAAAVARAAGATLRLAIVPVRATASPVYVEGLPVIDADLRSLAAAHDLAYLQGVAAGPRAAGAAVTVAVLDPAYPEGDATVPARLLGYAARTDVDLIVMTTHGRGGAARFWLGSVADVVTRASPVPVLLLGPAEGPRPAAGALFRRVLVPLDGSALAEQILAPALALGGLGGAAYRLLHVVERRGHGAADAGGCPRDEDEAWGYLEGLALRLERAGARVETRAVTADEVAPAILEQARAYGADLIAAATHGRSGLARLARGSVASTLLRAARQPVLVLRPRAAAPGNVALDEPVAASTGPESPAKHGGAARSPP
jgi:nucleotide-binding universal stress UspA family protein